MAEPLPIPDDMLRSGSLIDVEYEVQPGANDTLLGLAISQLKNDLWADKRFDYQGSRWYETQETETGEPYRAIIITVSVRKYPRGERPELYEAGLFIPLAAFVALVGLYAYSQYLKYRTATVVKQTVDVIVNSDLPTEQKRELVDQVTNPSAGPTWLEQIKATLGGGLTALAVIGGAWAFFTLMKKRGGEADS